MYYILLYYICMCINLRVGVFRDVDPALDARRFCAAGYVDSVPEETISGHPISNHTCHHLPRVDSNCDLLRRAHGKWK